ncbi:hypothetical protein LQ757_05855 [Agromyces sp. SYSU K20354]|uniref:hypothetical protein n=1 Tax=Agromyces cavernae TaxID=2898659 RepID=UPI001E5D495E|nr:hypothetical protein [Agromyces cavernae]MCD2441800.1 hypothetical protein [Agromyces cavernae]
MDKIIGLVVFVIMSSGFVGLGVYMLRHLDAATAFFESRGASLYGRRVARGLYKRANIRIGAVAFTVAGSIFVLVGLTRLAVSVVALVGLQTIG